MTFHKKPFLNQKATTYVITYHEFNHSDARPGFKPLDERFLNSPNDYIYYLIDRKVPDILKKKPVLHEHNLDPQLFAAGGKYLAEWSFLLAEQKHQFCSYPFFVISSRFYEKNKWLYSSLDQEWDQLFAYLQHFGWGWLPSYNSPMRWVNLEWERQLKKRAWEYSFFPFKEKFFRLIEDIYQIRIPEDYSYTASVFCNYIGFNSRKELCEYVDFYRPFIDYFFDDSFKPKRDFNEYVRTTGNFRNEKPFTFLLECICHLFFYARQKTYFALHYDGYYKIDEAKKNMERMMSFDIPFTTTLDRWFKWKIRKMRSEGIYARLRSKFN